MRNRVAGFIIIFIALLMGFIIYSFNNAMTDIVNSACSHGESCPMWGTIKFQTNVSISIMAFVIILGVYLAFFSERYPIQMKPHVKINKDSYKEILSELDSDERKLFEKVLDSDGSIYQSKLVKGTDMNKVKVTRVLDKLEGRGLVERKRRGMSNIVVLNH